MRAALTLSQLCSARSSAQFQAHTSSRTELPRRPASEAASRCCKNRLKTLNRCLRSPNSVPIISRTGLELGTVDLRAPLGPLWCQLGVSYARRSGVSYPIARVYTRVVLLGADRRPLAYAHVRRDRCPTVAEAGEPRGERSTVVMGQSPSVPLPSPLPLSPIVYPPVSSAAAGSVVGSGECGCEGPERGHACSFRRGASLT